jgi:uncharacterized protein YfiM (DUF2279 family)
MIETAILAEIEACCAGSDWDQSAVLITMTSLKASQAAVADRIQVLSDASASTTVVSFVSNAMLTPAGFSFLESRDCPRSRSDRHRLDLKTLSLASGRRFMTQHS